MQQDTETDSDGYNNLSLSSNLSYKISNNADISLNFLNTEGNTQFDRSTQNETNFEKQTLGITAKFMPAKIWQSTLSVARSLDDGFNFRHDNSVTPTYFNTRTYAFNWQNNFYINDHSIITAGLDYLDDEVKSSEYTSDPRDNTGTFVQYQDQFSNIDVLAGLRHEENEQFGSHTTGNISSGYKLNKNHRLVVSYGTAFKAPTFNELFFSGFGNINTKPEESQSLEISIRGKFANSKWSLTAYETRVDNLIAFDFALSKANNINEANIQGLEASLTTSFSGWNINTRLTFQDPKDASTGKILARREKRQLGIDISKDYGSFTSGLKLTAKNTRFNDSANTVRLGGYAVTDIYTSYKISTNIVLRARINNLFNKKYETADGFNALDRSLFINIGYQIS